MQISAAKLHRAKLIVSAYFGDVLALGNMVTPTSSFSTRPSSVRSSKPFRARNLTLKGRKNVIPSTVTRFQGKYNLRSYVHGYKRTLLLRSEESASRSI